jgi:hypothetical protein
MKPEKLVSLVAALIIPLMGYCASMTNEVSRRSQNQAPIGPGLNDAVVLIIRHADKPEMGQGLSAAGERRAQSYARVFQEYAIDSQPLSLDYLLSAADSENSHRPRLTLEPLSKALGLKLDLRFTHQNCQDLVNALRSETHGKHILICWRHGEMPELLRAFGVNPVKLLPNGVWPENEFGWVLQLVFDHDGRVIPGKTLRRAL